ncbi:hypothetical protein HMPREF9442_00803 [Paraprevotella xylaniphila YIT 11841]|uniref:Uncharacterized protein n=1 Tax=Paraprevotella xylaniphila YIT 11841 TaxID=762982 RepID=F3QRK1_9BACT|nr:hypothetical protein HMPREF9442_00803 [Paraprevotella xylaniphila YIT 11841]
MGSIFFEVLRKFNKRKAISGRLSFCFSHFCTFYKRYLFK